MPDNADRADWALLAVQAFADRTRGPGGGRDLTNAENFEEVLGDLLGDLHHALDRVRNAPESVSVWLSVETPDIMSNLLERGRGYYEEELAEERAEAFPEPPSGKHWAHPAVGSMHPAGAPDDFACGHWVLADD